MHRKGDLSASKFNICIPVMQLDYRINEGDEESDLRALS